MIDARQAAYIRDRIWCSDQDYFYWSCLRGEPFLEGDVLYFFDGHALTVVGSPVDPYLSDAETAAQMDHIVSRWLATDRVDFINYYGPIEPPFEAKVRDGWSIVWELERDRANVDSWVDFADRDVLSSRYARAALRAVRARDLCVSLHEEAVLGWEHIELLHEQRARIGHDISDLAMVLGGLTIVRSRAALLAEVRCGAHLGGFVLCHEFFSGRPFLIVACFDRSCTGASDAAYAALIRHYAHKGASRFNLGYTIHEGLFRYKAKWGGVRMGRPFVQVIWIRASSSESWDGCLHWPCRFTAPREPNAANWPVAAARAL